MKRVGKSFEPIDGEALLKELHTQKSEHEDNAGSEVIVKPVVPKAKPNNVSDESRRRQSIMDNTKVPFIFNAIDGTVHDKDCPLAKKIPGKCFKAAYELPRDKEKICPSCFKAAMVRLMVGSDKKHINAYCKFFEKIGFGKGILYQLAVRSKTSLLDISKDQIKLKVNDDKWLLIIINNKVELWHNNYSICDDDTRIIFDTYHKQAVYKLNGSQGCRVLADIIINYSWKKHVEMNKAEEAHKKALDQLKKQWETKTNYQINKIGIFKSKVTYIDIDKNSAILFKKAKIKIYKSKTINNDLSPAYPVHICKVKHKDLPKFKRIMNNLKQMSYSEEHQNYISFCFDKAQAI